MTVRLERRIFSMPELGGESPLPMVGAPLENPYQISGAIPQEIIEGSRYGNPANLYPYQEQDGYDRKLSEQSLETVVLENEQLRAVFLPGLGGRLWELFDKERGKQLLHSPGSIQFANLALRNAWFAGGIEWNIGTRGHSPGTCSPLHAALVRSPDGTEVLRMWEFDRLREVVFQLDAWLPDGSPVLLVAIRLRNPNDFSVPMYWWTNAAVPQTPGSRVVVPADSAFASNYEGGISRVRATDDDGIDCTWPANNTRARDFFFDIPPESRRWIVNADEDGDGLAMVSTPELRGRKLFVWGESPGGSRWQDWLSPDGGRYAEIQAGLAQTQFQHLEMPAGSEWSWVEAYGNARVDTGVAHGVDWDSAVGHCGDRVAALVTEQTLESAHSFAAALAGVPPYRGILSGTGWGALESARRARHGLPWVDEAGTPFAPESITSEQQPWLDLLGGQEFTGATSFVRGDDWAELLAAGGPRGTIHRAVLAHASGALEDARMLYAQSLEEAPTAIAHRGLAVLALDAGDSADGLDRYRLACGLEPANVSLLVEAATTAIREGAAGLALGLIRRSTVGSARRGRIRLLEARALALSGDSGAAADILRAGIEVADLREGENAMAALWREVIVDAPVPADYQFSMNDAEQP
jgi:hypothetical protein